MDCRKRWEELLDLARERRALHLCLALVPHVVDARALLDDLADQARFPEPPAPVHAIESTPWALQRPLEARDLALSVQEGQAHEKNMPEDMMLCKHHVSEASFERSGRGAVDDERVRDAIAASCLHTEWQLRRSVFFRRAGRQPTAEEEQALARRAREVSPEQLVELFEMPADAFLGWLTAR